jgi:hypothetical protein
LNLPSGLGEGIFFSILSKLEYNIVPGFQATPKTQTFSVGQMILHHREWTKVFEHFQFSLYLNSFSKYYLEVKS